ncbi:MAG TPA: hypothetical protein VEB86_15125 [Chryseosolibacter sp.]|nr:hypothetical protein [Chryseosolibacter sp.]
MISILLKAAMVAVFLPNIAEGFYEAAGRQVWVFKGGDTKTYFLPVENLLSRGAYAPDYRMPGYGIIYFGLRSVTPEPVAQNLLIMLQLATSALATFCLAKLLYLVTKRDLVFYVTFFLFGLSMKSTYWDLALLTESFALSTIIFAAYFFILWTETRKNRNIVLSGFFLTWLIFLRPAYLPVLLIVVAGVLLVGYRLHAWPWKRTVLAAGIFLTPFIFFDGLWIVRNFQKYERIIPLTKTIYYPELEQSYEGALMDFVIAYGGDRSFWNESGALRWFLPEKKHRMFGILPPNLAPEPPDEIYTRAFNKDSLEVIRNEIAIIEAETTSAETAGKLTADVKRRLGVYKESIKRDKPQIYYITSRLKMIKRSLVHTWTEYLPNISLWDMDVRQKLLKVYNGSLYLSSIVLGFAGIVYFLIKRDLRITVLGGIGVFATLIYPILGHVEPRYYLPAYPFMLGVAILFSVESYTRIRSYYNRR